MISWLVDQLLKVPPGLALLFVFLLPALEASILLGFLLPGETAVVVGGFLAYEHKVPLAAVIILACVGAVLGDSAGYEVGRRWGDAVLNRMPKRFVKPQHVVQGKNLINRLGGKAVFVGRWTAVLRALVPSLCGTAKMPYRSFLAWNAAGGVSWAVAFSLLGYLAGSAWQRIEGYTNTASYIIFGAALVAVIVVVIVNKSRQAKKDRATVLSGGADGDAAAEPTATGDDATTGETATATADATEGAPAGQSGGEAAASGPDRAAEPNPATAPDRATGDRDDRGDHGDQGDRDPGNGPQAAAGPAPTAGSVGGDPDVLVGGLAEPGQGERPGDGEQKA